MASIPDVEGLQQMTNTCAKTGVPVRFCTCLVCQPPAGLNASASAPTDTSRQSIEKMIRDAGPIYSTEALEDYVLSLAADAARYRWLCEFREWPEAVSAAFDCSGKVMIDFAIDSARGQGMTVKKLNDAPVLDQIEQIGYMKFMALLVHKLAPNGVTITAEDISRFPPDGVLLSHGHYDGFEFRIVTQEAAERIAEHQAATNRGRA